jgi:hypothetical protein
MSTLEAAETMVLADDVASVRAPYRRGDLVCAVSPEGVRYQVRVEAVTPTQSGDFALVGVVTAPRKFRSHVLSTVVGADGYGSAIRPA